MQRISKIVSGGQTGAELGTLDAAIWCKDFPHGGWCPKGRKNELGDIPDCYHLTETASEAARACTEANIVDSDATLIFTYNEPTGGSELAIELAEKHGKPWSHVDLYATEIESSTESVITWLGMNKLVECVLNVTGSRESEAPGIHGEVMRRVVELISRANGKCFYPPVG